MEIGLGQLGLSPDEFWGMTPLEFLHAQKGFFEMYKTREKQAWHRTIELININLPRGKRINADQVLRDKPKAKRMSVEDRRKEVERVSKLKKRNVISQSKLSI
jgi:uncharacterized protein YktB (UPF0637 family)